MQEIYFWIAKVERSFQSFFVMITFSYQAFVLMLVQLHFLQTSLIQRLAMLSYLQRILF
jgi:hypothetical protein